MNRLISAFALAVTGNSKEPRHRLRRVLGLALVGLLALVVTIIALLVQPLHLTKRVDKLELETCNGNLVAVYELTARYYSEHNRLPNEAGASFLREILVDHGKLDAEAHVRQFSCPTGFLELQVPSPEGSTPWFDPQQAIEGTWTAYAARDNRAFPLTSLDATEVLVACANRLQQNHRDITHLLFADGHIEAWSLSDLKKMGKVPTNADRLIVGPESPIAALRKLSQG